MGRMYTVPFNATVTAAGGNTALWEITPAAQKPIILRGFTLGQISEVGDSAEEGLRITVNRVPATVTSGNGSAVTPVAIDEADAAAGFTAEANGTTPATSSGTLVVVEEMAWNNRNSPYERWYPDDRFAHKIKNAGALTIVLETTLADDMTFCGTAWVEEL